MWVMRERKELRMTQCFDLSNEQDGVAIYGDGEDGTRGRTDFGGRLRINYK